MHLHGWIPLLANRPLFRIQHDYSDFKLHTKNQISKHKRECPSVVRESICGLQKCALKALFSALVSRYKAAGSSLVIATYGFWHEVCIFVYKVKINGIHICFSV
jgi:hypothetical protein